MQNASIPKRTFLSFGHATARMRDLLGGEKGTFNIALFFSSAFFFTSKNLPQPMLVQVFLQTEADVLPLSATITPAKTICSAYRRCCERVFLSPLKRMICPGISSILRTSPITETQHPPAFLSSGRKHIKSPRGGIPQDDHPTLADSRSGWMGRLLPARSLWPSAGLFYPVNFFLRRRLKMDVNAKMSEAATGL